MVIILLKKISFLYQNKIAHRGIHGKYQENTIESFKEAVKSNYTIELDLRMTQDNYLVIYHDDTLKRLHHQNKKITKLNIEDIKYYKNIPTLEEVLSLVNGKVPIIIEIKWDKRIKRLIQKLNQVLKNYQGDIAIMSFYLQALINQNKENPNYPIGYLLNRFLPNYFFAFIFLKLNLLHLDFLAVDLTLLKDSLILKLRKKYLILGYSINTNKEYDQYKEYADNFIWDSFKY